MSNRIEGLSTRAQLEMEANKYGLKTADAFFAGDEDYKDRTNNSKNNYISNNLDKYKEYVNNASALIDGGINNLRVKPSEDQKDLKGYLKRQTLAEMNEDAEKTQKAVDRGDSVQAFITGAAKGVPFGNRLHKFLAKNDYEQHERAAAEHPNWATAGNIAGNVGSGIAMGGGAGILAKGATTGARIATAAGVGGAHGATTRGDEEVQKYQSGEQDLGETVKRAGVQTAAGAVGNVFGPAMGYVKGIKPALQKPINALAEGTGNAVAGIGERGILDGDIGSAGEIAADFGFGAGLSAGMDYVPEIPSAAKTVMNRLREKIKNKASNGNADANTETETPKIEVVTESNQLPPKTDGPKIKKAAADDFTADEAKELLSRVVSYKTDDGGVEYMLKGKNGMRKEVSSEQVEAWKAKTDGPKTEAKLDNPTTETKTEAETEVKTEGPTETTISKAETTTTETPSEVVSAKNAQTTKTVTEYQNSVDEGLVAFAENIMSGNLKNPSRQNYSIGDVSERTAADIKNLTGIDVSNFEHNIRGDYIEHIQKRHGAQGEANNTMSDINDLGRIKYVLDNYDNVEVGRNNNKFYNSDNKPAPTVLYTKKVNGNYYVVEAVPNTKKNRLEVITAYKTKGSGEVERALSHSSERTPQYTSQTLHADTFSPATNNIQNIPVKSQGEEPKKTNRLKEKLKKKQQTIEQIPETAQESAETAPNLNETPSVEQSVAPQETSAQNENVAAVEEIIPKSKIIRPADLIPNETTVASKQGEPYSELVERMEKQAQKDKPKRLKDMTDEEAAAWAEEVKEEYWKTVDRAKQQAEVIAAQNGDDVITVTVKNKNRQKVSKRFVNQDKLRVTKIKDRSGNLVDVVYIDDGSGKIGRVYSPENVMPDKNFTADTPDGKKTYLYIGKLPNSTDVTVRAKNRARAGKGYEMTQVNENTLMATGDENFAFDGAKKTDGKADGGIENARNNIGEKDIYGDDLPVKMTGKKNSSFNDGYAKLGTETVENGDIIAALEAEGFKYDGKHKLVREDGQVEIEFVLNGDDITGVKINGKPAALADAQKRMNGKDNKFEVLYDKSGTATRDAKVSEMPLSADAIYTILRQNGIDIKAQNMKDGQRGAFYADGDRVGIAKNLNEFDAAHPIESTMLHEAVGHRADYINDIMDKVDDIDGLRDILNGLFDDYDKRLAAYTDREKPYEILADAAAVYAQDPIFMRVAHPSFYDVMNNLDDPVVRQIIETAKLSPQESVERTRDFIRQEMEKVRQEKARQARNESDDVPKGIVQKVSRHIDELKEKFIGETAKLNAEIFSKDAYIRRLTNKADGDAKKDLEHLLARKNSASVLADNSAARLQMIADEAYLDIANDFARQKGVNVTKDMFAQARQIAGEILMYRRIAYESKSGEVVNSAFVTPQRAKEILGTYDAALTQKVINFYDNFMDEFFTTLKLNKRGMNPKQLKEYMDNDFYIRFQPQGRFLVPTEAGKTDLTEMGIINDKGKFNARGNRLFKHRTGSSDILFDPVTATIIHARKIAMEAEMNNAKVATVELLKEYASESIREIASVPENKNVPVLTVWDYGEKHTYIVPDKIADAFTPPKQSELSKAIGTLNHGVFYTQILYNPGWMPFSNILRDQDRTARNLNKIWGLGHLEMLGRLAYLKFNNKKYKELAAQFSDLLQAEGRHGTLDLIKWSDDLPAAAKNDGDALVKLSSAVERLVTPHGRMESIKSYENLSRLAAAWATKDKYQDGRSLLSLGAKKDLGDKTMSDDDIFDFVKRYTGTPFTAEGGQANIAGFMYFNSIIQSLARDIETRFIHNRDGIGGVALQTVNILIPAIFKALIMNGKIFSKDDQEMYNDISKYERDNFNVFPLFRTEGGQVVFIRAPIDDTARYFQKFWTYCFDDMINSDLYSNEEQLVAALGYAADAHISAFPDINPVIQSAGRLWEYSRGQNPYHPFYQKPLIPYDVYEKGGFFDEKNINGETVRGHWYYLQNDLLNSAAGSIYRFGAKERPQAKFGNSLKEKMARNIDAVNSSPIGRNYIGRILRITTPQTTESQYYKINRVIKAGEKVIAKNEWKQKQGILVDTDKMLREYERARREEKMR